MKKIFGLSLFSYVLASRDANAVQGKNNFIVGTQNDVKGNRNFQLSHNVDVNGSNNKLVGANYQVQGDNIQMFGTDANVEFQNENYPVGKRVFKIDTRKPIKPIEIHSNTKNENPLAQIKSLVAAKGEQQQNYLQQIRKQILQNKRAIMNQIFQLNNANTIFGSDLAGSHGSKKAQARNQKIQKKDNFGNQAVQKHVEAVQIDTPQQKKRAIAIKNSNEPTKVIKQINESITNGSLNQKQVLTPAIKEQSIYDPDNFFGFSETPSNNITVPTKTAQPKKQEKHTQQVKLTQHGGLKQETIKHSKSVNQGTANIVKEKTTQGILERKQDPIQSTIDPIQSGASVKIVKGIPKVQPERKLIPPRIKTVEKNLGLRQQPQARQIS